MGSADRILWAVRGGCDTAALLGLPDRSKQKREVLTLSRPAAGQQSLWGAA